MCLRVRACVHVRACECVCVHVHVCVCVCVCVCVDRNRMKQREKVNQQVVGHVLLLQHSHTHKCVHTCVHTHIQRTHVYTHTYLLKAGSFLAGVEMKDQLVAGSFALRAQQHLHCPGTFLQTHLSLFCSLEQCSKQKCGVCVHAA